MLEPGKILDTLGAGIFGIAGLENVVISEGTRPPDPWGSPGISPKSGDEDRSRKSLGIDRGRKELKFRGFFVDKTPKIIDFRGGDGDNNFGDLGVYFGE